MLPRRLIECPTPPQRSKVTQLEHQHHALQPPCRLLKHHHHTIILFAMLLCWPLEASRHAVRSNVTTKPFAKTLPPRCPPDCHRHTTMPPAQTTPPQHRSLDRHFHAAWLNTIRTPLTGLPKPQHVSHVPTNTSSTVAIMEAQSNVASWQTWCRKQMRKQEVIQTSSAMVSNILRKLTS